jgi:cardiolipin synthase
MKRLYWLLTILAFFGCARVLAVREIPEINLGEANFFRTIEAHTDAPIVSGNRIEILLNGDETFPMMLREIERAKSTITFAQYLYEDGSIARDLAQAFLPNAAEQVSRRTFFSTVTDRVKRPPKSLQL